jgi:hypothetical protein
MKKLFSILAAAILIGAFALPLNAAPIFVPRSEQVRLDSLETVHHKRKHYRNWRADRPWNRRHAWRSCRYYGNCYPRRYYGYRENYPRYYRRSGVSIFIPL